MRALVFIIGFHDDYIRTDATTQHTVNKKIQSALFTVNL